MDRVEIIAAACHQAWYAYAVLALGELGEPWATAPDWQKALIRNAVEFWDEYMERRDIRGDADVQQLCEASHGNWWEQMEISGWKYGPVKDPVAKTHPCMIPYEELPEEQRSKDRVVVEAYLAMRSVLDPNRHPKNELVDFDEYLVRCTLWENVEGGGLFSF